MKSFIVAAFLTLIGTSSAIAQQWEYVANLDSGSLYVDPKSFWISPDGEQAIIKYMLDFKVAENGATSQRFVVGMRTRECLASPNAGTFYIADLADVENVVAIKWNSANSTGLDIQGTLLCAVIQRVMKKPAAPKIET